MNRWKRRLRRIAAGLAFVLLPLRAAVAHDGPPYPIFVDEHVAGWNVSIWADPDVGTGSFYYYIDAPPNRSADELRVRVFSTPEDGTAPEARGFSAPAEPEEPFQQFGTVEFDHRGLWNTRFAVERTADGHVLGELTYSLAVTPAGLGTLDLLWFAFPFLLLGGIWMRVLFAQRAYERSANLSTSNES